MSDQNEGGLDHSALRRRCESFLRDMDLSAPFTARDVCTRLARKRGRTIYLEPMLMEQPGPYGLLIATDTVDIIVYASNTSPLHQELIILHEAAHILHVHGGHVVDWDHARAALTDLSPELVRSFLHRSTYSAHDELLAEAMASMLLRMGRGRSSRSSAAPAPDGAGIVERLSRSLEHGPY